MLQLARLSGRFVVLERLSGQRVRIPFDASKTIDQLKVEVAALTDTLVDKVRFNSRNTVSEGRFELEVIQTVPHGTFQLVQKACQPPQSASAGVSTPTDSTA